MSGSPLKLSGLGNLMFAAIGAAGCCCGEFSGFGGPPGFSEFSGFPGLLILLVPDPEGLGDWFPCPCPWDWLEPEGCIVAIFAEVLDVEGLLVVCVILRVDKFLVISPIPFPEFS